MAFSDSNSKLPSSIAPQASLERKTITYEVGSLDTIHTIALKFNMKTTELLRLNGLPSTSRIYPGQLLTVFENPNHQNQENSRTNHQRRPRNGSTNVSSLADVDISPPTSIKAESSPKKGHIRNSSIQNTDMSFPTVITPSYRSTPLLVQLRQTRDKLYFSDNHHAPAAHQGLTDSMAATKQRYSVALGSSFHHIPEEMRFSSKDVVKEHVRYYIKEQRNVFGEITLTPNSIIFEPALDDPVTRQVGLLSCQFQCDLKDIVDVRIIEVDELLSMWSERQNSGSEPNSPAGSAKIAKISSSSPKNTNSVNSNSSNIHSSGGPSSNYLSTGSISSIPNPHSSLSVNHQELNPENGPKFLQLSVMIGKPSDGTQSGKIVYFLINRQSLESLYQKLNVWLAQANPIMPIQRGSTVSTPSSTTSTHVNLLKDRNSPVSSRSATTSTSTSASGTNNEPSKPPVVAADPPTLHGKSTIITDPFILQKLAASLPNRYKHSAWTLLYANEVHGFSLNTFYSKVRKKGPVLIVLEDDGGSCFGGYLAAPNIEIQKSYYGTGESFLFTTYPTFNVYPWSQLNEFFLYTNVEGIALGGGRGKFGLWLGQDLIDGTSAPCDTYLNSTLSSEDDFRIVCLEVWGLNDAMGK